MEGPITGDPVRCTTYLQFSGRHSRHPVCALETALCNLVQMPRAVYISIIEIGLLQHGSAQQLEAAWTMQSARL